MIVVELIDRYRGFDIVTRRIKTRDPRSLLWIVSWVTFFLSSVIDNLTSTIVMISLVQRLISNKDVRLMFAGIIVIAANAGGAWTPIGDVTTTMLWIGGQITAAGVMKSLFLPSVACLLIPLVFLSTRLKNTVIEDLAANDDRKSKIDLATLLFFFGILMAVGALESMNILSDLATWLNQTIKSQTVIITIVGLMSAVIDNVPLVGASMAMYPVDNFMWEYLAYCAGTGGSILIIGSAAGVAAMSLEKIDFIWYLKKVSVLALIGYLAGCGIYLLLNEHCRRHRKYSYQDCHLRS